MLTGAIHTEEVDTCSNMLKLQKQTLFGPTSWCQGTSWQCQQGMKLSRHMLAKRFGIIMMQCLHSLLQNATGGGCSAADQLMSTLCCFRCPPASHCGGCPCVTSRLTACTGWFTYG